MLIVRLGLILMLVGSIAAGGLALLNTHTAPIIAEYKAMQQALAREEVMSSVGGERFEERHDGDFTYWRAFDETGKWVGDVAIARGKGYSSTIETVCGFDTTFRVTGLKITFQQETPGLGAKADEIKKGEKEPRFLTQFRGKDALTLAVKKDRGDIDAITGATITSRAVTNSVREVAERVRRAEGLADDPPPAPDGSSIAASGSADAAESTAGGVDE